MDRDRRIDYDWYPGRVPDNVRIGDDVYLDSSFGFAGFLSLRDDAMTLGAASGVYDRASFFVGPLGAVTVGDYTVLNGCSLVCEDRITIGSHCLLAWGSVLTDSWFGAEVPLLVRRHLLEAAASDPARCVRPGAPARPVTLEDNVWVGFDSVVLPGVRLGRGCIVGCKVVVDTDVPPYAVVAGNPARIVRYLTPDDNEAARREALRAYRGRGEDNRRKPTYDL